MSKLDKKLFCSDLLSNSWEMFLHLSKWAILILAVIGIAAFITLSTYGPYFIVPLAMILVSVWYGYDKAKEKQDQREELREEIQRCEEGIECYRKIINKIESEDLEDARLPGYQRDLEKEIRDRDNYIKELQELNHWRAQ